MEPQSLTQLLTVMEEQLKVMSDLTVLSKKKSQVLVEGNLSELDVLLRGEQALVWHMGRLEERRFQLQTQVAAELGLHPSELTCERLVELTPAADGKRVEQVAREYGSTAQELMDLNNLNTELIQQAMAYVDFSLQLLSPAGSGSGQVYSARGYRGNGDGKLRRLDNRA